MKNFLFFTFITAFILKASFCQAQTGRTIEEQKRRELTSTEKSTIKTGKNFYYDYGGWLDVRYSRYIDNDNNNESPDLLRDSFERDLRLWAKGVYRHFDSKGRPREHGFYLRLKDLYYTDYPETGPGDYDHEGPAIDLGYVNLDLNPFKAEAGRRYFNIGTGLVYGDIHDGFQVSYFRHPWHIGIFASHTLPHEDNIDTSVPGYDKGSDRTFIGTGIGYTAIKNIAFYGFYLKQMDHSDENPEDEDQQYTYDSSYFGFGLKANNEGNTNFWWEIIKSTGNSYTYPSGDKSSVDAWATVIGTDHYWDNDFQPQITVEYAFGSGDGERSSVTDTVNGNLSGRDNNFTYFGYYYSGYALSPRLSNLHVYKLSYEFLPFPKIKYLNKLLFSIDYFYFLKHKKAGGISDYQAVNPERDIGHEVDLHIDWEALSDLRIGFDYAYFMPGEAYEDSADDREMYIGSRISLTF
jgi:hypothetical protein